MIGTSMSVDAQYLAPLTDALRSATGNERIRFANISRNGSNGLLAIFEAGLVAELEPDLVLIECSISDLGPVKEPFIPAVLTAILQRVRSRHPSAEFLFVELARALDLGTGSTAAIDLYEAVADAFGIASVNLAALSLALIAQGRAVWHGDPLRALTRDGVHHTEAAATLLGIPFAQAVVDLVAHAPQSTGDDEFDVDGMHESVRRRFAPLFEPPRHDGRRLDGEIFCAWEENNSGAAIELVRRSLAGGPRVVETASTDFRRGHRVPIRSLIASSGWQTGTVQPDVTIENLGGWRDQELLFAASAGERVRFTLDGTFAFVVGLAAGGGLSVDIDGRRSTLPVAESSPRPAWFPVVITDRIGPGPHVIEITTTTPGIVFRDVYAIGAVTPV